MKEIIMFAGNIGCGKAYMMNKKVQELKETGHSLYLISFADPIKTFVKNFIGLDKNGHGFNIIRDVNSFELFIEKIETFLSSFQNGNRGINLNPFKEKYYEAMEMIYQEKSDNFNQDLVSRGIRILLQMIGTEIGQSYNKEIWPYIASKKIEFIVNNTDVDYAIIDDFRFLFEYYNVIRNFPDTKITPYYITADIEIRAKRRNISVEELLKQEEHISEQESKHVILPWMKLHFSNNIIENNGE